MLEATIEGQEYTQRKFPIDTGYFQVVRRAMEEPPDGYVFDALERRAGELWVTYRKEPGGPA